MKRFANRLLAFAVLAILAWILMTGASATKTPVLHPDKLIILGTTDVKGKTSPCG